MISSKVAATFNRLQSEMTRQTASDDGANVGRRSDHPTGSTSGLTHFSLA